jgi:hypothetical protein
MGLAIRNKLTALGFLVLYSFKFFESFFLFFQHAKNKIIRKYKIIPVVLQGISNKIFKNMG